MIDPILSLLCLLGGTARIQGDMDTSFRLAWRWEGELAGNVLVIPASGEKEQDLVLVPEIARSSSAWRNTKSACSAL